MFRFIFFLCFSFTFSLAAQETVASKPGLKLTGGISAGSFFYTASGIPNRRPPAGYSLNANLTARAGQFSIPLSAVLNDQGSTLNNPFNRFGISPTYKWATVHLGHRNLTFSPFVLNGATFFGAGADLRPGKLRLSAMYGRFQRARIRRFDEGLAADFEYQREGYSVRLGIGDYRNFVDLIYLQASDDITSLPIDTSYLGSNLPKDNTVLGLSTRKEFFGGKLFFTANGGLSLLTRNQRAAGLGEERQDVVDRLSFLLTPNISTSANYAGDAGLTLRLKTFGLGLNYRRVMPDYQSLGVNYLLDDTETITIAPRISVAKGKLNINGSLGLQRNNLAEQRKASTLRQIGSANLDYQSDIGLGFSLQYSNYRLDQEVIVDTILNDSILLDQINHQVSFAPRFFKSGKTATHTIVLVAGWQELDDRNPGTGDLVDNQVLMANLNYSGYLKPGKWRLSAGVNAFRLTSSVVGNDRYGAHLGFGKTFGKQLTIRTKLAYNLLMRESETGSNYSLNGTIRYAFSKKMALEATVGQLQNDFGGRDFSELRGRVRFNYRWR